MLAVNEREQLVLYQTSVDTDHGRLEVWVDGLLSWKAGVRAFESPTGVEQLDELAQSWHNGIREVLNMHQRREALAILDGYMADVLREVNEVFSDASDPLCDAWEQAAALLRHVFAGLVEYYVDEADLFLDSNEAMPAFTQPQVVSLGGGLRDDGRHPFSGTRLAANCPVQRDQEKHSACARQWLRSMDRAVRAAS